MAFLTNNGLYVFPDGHVYVAVKPASHSSCWTFFTVDNWFKSPTVLDYTWIRFHDESFSKNIPRTKRNRFGIKNYGRVNLLFTGTVLAKKVKGKRVTSPDRDWFWKLDFRERAKY